jgi:hypothetical protein
VINKSFLRILACNALSYKQGTQYATIAKELVYDTELDDLDARDDGSELRPRILIYTDSGSADLSGQNPSYIATYYNVKLRIELIIFGGYQGFGVDCNEDRFLAIILDVFEQQVFDALFKAQNSHAEKFRNSIVFKSGLQSIPAKDSQSDRKILSTALEIDIQLPEQYTSGIYPQDRIDIFDYYPNYVNLLPVSIRGELEKILAVNDAGDKIEIINSELPIPTVRNEFDND